MITIKTRIMNNFNPHNLSFEDRVDNIELNQYIKVFYKSYKHTIPQSEAKKMGKNYIFSFHGSKLFRGNEVKYYNFTEVEWDFTYYSKNTYQELDEFFRCEDVEPLMF